jgi:predicted metal-binding protein
MMGPDRIVPYYQPLVTIFVCRSCPRQDSRFSTAPAEIGLSSDRLAEAVAELVGAELDITIRRVECLSSCLKPIAVVLRTGNKQRLLLIDTPDDGAPMIVELARSMLPCRAKR